MVFGGPIVDYAVFTNRSQCFVCMYPFCTIREEWRSNQHIYGPGRSWRSGVQKLKALAAREATHSNETATVFEGDLDLLKALTG